MAVSSTLHSVGVTHFAAIQAMQIAHTAVLMRSSSRDIYFHTPSRNQTKL